MCAVILTTIASGPDNCPNTVLVPKLISFAAPPESIVASRSGVTKSLSGGEMYGGFPARPIKEQNKRDAVYSEVLKIKKILNQLITN